VSLNWVDIRGGSLIAPARRIRRFLMPNAIFSCSVAYRPGGGGLLTQAFNITADYSSVSAGTLATDANSAPAPIAIPFGGIGADANGLVIRNNTGVDLGIRLNGGNDDQYHLASGGLLMHWASEAAETSPLKSCTVMLASAPPENGSIDYLVFGT
jgi:hypothetical protein